MIQRTICLYCEQEGVTTPLVQTGRGGCCPIHSGDFIEALRANALATLDLHSRPAQRRGLPNTNKL